MLTKTLITSTTLLMCLFSDAFAQENSNQSSQPLNHYFGLQANGLIREIISLGGTGATISNPYLLNYSFNSTSSGWGLNMGVGYFLRNSDQGDETFERTTEFSNRSVRFGVERKVPFMKKWTLSYGLDFVHSKINSMTETRNEFEINDEFDGSSFSKSETSIKSNGFGPRFAFSYQLWPQLLVGTEASYYFIKSKTDESSETFSEFLNFHPVTGDPFVDRNEDESESSGSEKEFSFDLPLVLFLVFKF